METVPRAPDGRSESHLEKFIVDFVLEKVTEHVCLHLSDVITVRPVRLRSKGGAYLLATFWANVLQHGLNFPPSQYSYRRHEVSEEDSGGIRKNLLELNLELDGIKIYVDMASGALSVAGKFVYEWFVNKFRPLLVNFDPDFAADWVFVPTPVGDLPEQCDESKPKYYKTETEAYLLLEGRGCQCLKRQLVDRISEQLAADISETTKLTSSKEFWGSEEVEQQLVALNQCGGIFDGFAFIYPLWRSILHHWFSRAEEAVVYLATPLLDADRLCDVIDVCHQWRESSVKLATFYVNFRCSDDGNKDIGDVQRAALCRYSTSQQTFAECQVLRKIVHPLRQRLGTAFAARLPAVGNAEVLLSGASFSATDFSPAKMSTVSFFHMAKETFVKRYIEPLEVPAVTTCMLPNV